MVCGDCCELTEGGARTFAVCTSCARGGTSLVPAWRIVLVWVLVPIVVLAGLVATIVMLRR
jgi:hypothetical protein